MVYSGRITLSAGAEKGKGEKQELSVKDWEGKGVI